MSLKDGVCPICQSSEVFYQHDTHPRNSIQFDWKGGLHPHVYVCTSCGYMGNFADEKYFEQIRKHWTRVQDDLPEKPKHKDEN